MAAVAVVGVAAAAVAVAVMRSDPGEPEAAEALERARDAVAEAGSFRLTSTSEERSVVGELDGPGAQQVFRTVTDAEVTGDDLRAVVDSGDWADEIVRVDGAVYQRSAPDVDALADELWTVLPPEILDAALPNDGDLADLLLAITGLDMDGDGEIDPDLAGDPELAESLMVPVLAGYYLWSEAPTPAAPLPGGPGLPLPAGFVDTFGRFDDAEVVAHSGAGTTIAATRRLPDEVAAEIAAVVDVALPDGRIEIDLGGDHLPVALRLTVEGSSVTYSETITFADWGADVAIEVPDGEIDETPWIDEEAVAEVRGTLTALGPTELPDGLELAGIDAISADEAGEWGEPCGQLDLWYEPPLTTETEADAWYASPDYLDIFLLPAACAVQADPTPFEAGAYGDVPSRMVYGVVEVRIGDTVVRIDTTFTPDLPAIVASIRPFDLDAELARVAALAEDTWYGAGRETSTEPLT